MCGEHCWSRPTCAILDEVLRFYGGRADAEQSIGKVDYASLSPRRRAAEIKVPVLLVHGHADYTVVATHSKGNGRGA